LKQKGCSIRALKSNKKLIICFGGIYDVPVENNDKHKQSYDDGVMAAVCYLCLMGD
jgi:hypothetical protein